jgi:aspartate/methionine/tyrosine aminotransferase
MKNALAARSHAVEWSGIRVMFALADEIPGVINLGIGQPDFDTPAFIREAAKEALDQGFTRYPPAKGFMDLREAIAYKLKAENNIAADPAAEIFVAVGAMQVIFNTILHLVEPPARKSSSSIPATIITRRSGFSAGCRCRCRLTRKIFLKSTRPTSPPPCRPKPN